MPPGRLLNYPYVVVRIACDACGRAGRYRLARLAEKYGAQTELETLLACLAADCKHFGHSHPYRFRCRVRFCDLDPPRRPSDLPRVGLRVVPGGKP
jgi:hypothetical protein